MADRGAVATARRNWRGCARSWRTAIDVLRSADTLGIDLAAAIDAKIALNETKYPLVLARRNADLHAVRGGRLTGCARGEAQPELLLLGDRAPSSEVAGDVAGPQPRALRARGPHTVGPTSLAVSSMPLEVIR